MSLKLFFAFQWCGGLTPTNPAAQNSARGKLPASGSSNLPPGRQKFRMRGRSRNKKSQNYHASDQNRTVISKVRCNECLVMHRKP